MFWQVIPVLTIPNIKFPEVAMASDIH